MTGSYFKAPFSLSIKGEGAYAMARLIPSEEGLALEPDAKPILIATLHARFASKPDLYKAWREYLHVLVIAMMEDVAPGSSNGMRMEEIRTQ